MKSLKKILVLFVLLCGLAVNTGCDLAGGDDNGIPDGPVGGAGGTGPAWIPHFANTQTDLSKVAYSGTTFAAVGNEGTVLTSANITDWTEQEPETDSPLYDITWTGSSFFTVGYDGVIISYDQNGAFQDIVASEMRMWNIQAVAKSPSLYVAVSSNGVIHTSPDAITWKIQTSMFNTVFYDVIWSGSIFVAVGYDSTIPNSVIYTSPDGLSWTQRTIPVLSAGYRLRAVAYSSSIPRFVAVGRNESSSSSVVLTSTDGTAWTSQTNSGSYILDVVWSGTQFVATGDNICTSSDGMTWTTRTKPDGYYLRVVWSGTQFVAAGYYSSAGVIMTSANGTDWALQTLPVGTAGLTGIAYSGSMFVAITGNDSKYFYTSPNGSLWTRHTVSGMENYFYQESITWTGSWFVLTGNRGICTSTDGVSWTQQAYSDNSLYSIAYSGSRLVAVGAFGVIRTSDNNGATWTKRISGTVEKLNDVTWSGSQFVAVGEEGTILTSATGETWTKQNSRIDHDLTCVTWSQQRSLFAASGAGSVILTSPNGVDWTVRTYGTTDYLLDIAWSGTQFMAVGTYGIIYASPDGITWTIQNNGSTIRLNGVVWAGADHGFLAVGYQGLIVTSK